MPSEEALRPLRDFRQIAFLQRGLRIDLLWPRGDGRAGFCPAAVAWRWELLNENRR